MRTFLLLFCLAPLSLLAQNIAFQITDSGGQPLEGAVASLFQSADSTLLKTELSDRNGAVVFEKKPVQATFIYIEALGYRPIYVGAEQAGGQVLALEEISVGLKEVTVSARKNLFEVQADKLVVNVENSVLATGNSAFEILRKSPGVIIDQNDNLSLRGKNGVRILIDGKPSPLGAADLAALLQGMQASDIESIEIIANPSARYDAAGNAGIINIRLKKNKNFGANGSLGLGYAQALHARANTNGNINYRNKNINLFANYGNNWGNNWSFFNFYREQNDTVFDQKTQSNYHGLKQNFKAGADLFLPGQQTLGLLVSGFANQNIGSSLTRAPIAPKNNPEAISELLLANGERNNQRWNTNLNLNYVWNPRKDRSLSADVDYGYFNLRGTERIPNRYVSVDDESATLSEEVFYSETPTLIHLMSVKADWEQPLAAGKLEAGFKSARVATDNTFDFYNEENGLNVYDPLRSNQFVYTEWIHAAYLQWGREWKTWGLQAGLRAEQTASEGDLRTANDIADKNVKRAYTDLFPSASISWSANAKNRFALSYSRRIDRPVYADLNPFEFRLNDLTYSKGNPFLKPQYTDNIALNHTWNWKLNTALSYSYVSGFFANVSDTTEGRRSFLRKENFRRQDVWSLSSSYPFQITGWWSGYATATAALNQFRAEFAPGKSIRIDNYAVSTFLQNAFTLGQGITLELSGSFNTPSVWGGTYRTRAFWFMDAGLQKKFDQLTLRIAVSDIFLSMRWRGVAEFGGLYAVASGGWESRQFRLNATYSFGKSTVKKARQRKSGLDDLNKRVE